ncbi:type VI secretion system contractile sheath large subunit [Marinicellulosiphila megalodicopiae]|uniref:type VI secretion system contractile sheath large subunit n=1 Tax=Marinicellulosiphila megalodicopiae TaxID=2724896 RepID=UPI003BAF41AA
MTELNKEDLAQAQSEEVSLLDQIMEQTRLKPEDDGYETAKTGVKAFIADLLEPSRAGEKVEQKVVDHMISEIDKKISGQMDQIIHNDQFKQLESAWRGAKMVVDRTDFRENVRLELLSVTKEELLEDFEDVPEVSKSGLYQHAYVSEYGQFGGKPYGAIIGNYAFSPNAQDIRLLQQVASVGAMSHAPFIAGAGPEFFGLDEYDGLPALKDLESIFEGPQYAKWQSFRESDDSRNVGLTVPRFMLRQPYGVENSIKEFEYTENVEGTNENFLWGNASYAFATNLTASFAKYRWCPNIIGPQSGGAIQDLPVHNYKENGEMKQTSPTEVMLSDRKEFELAEQGFMGLTLRKGTDNATFFSANSCQKPKFFGNDEEGKQAAINYKLGTELPYLFVVNRLAHYIKVLQRENIGSWKTRSELERELSTWIRQFVADQDNPPAAVRSRRPLREAQITVEDDDSSPGFYRVQMNVRPHFKYMGASFTLSLAGKLDKS